MEDSNNCSEIKVKSETDKLDTVKSDLIKDGEKHEANLGLQDKKHRQSMDDDDIPDNFFDDFSNNEFMEGLNVLDSWDENQKACVIDENGKDSGKKSEIEKSDKEKLDRGRYNRSKDYSPKRSPYRRVRSPFGKHVRHYSSRSISPRRRRSRSRPTNSPRRGRYCYSPPRNRDVSPRYRRRDYSPYRSRNSTEIERSRDRDRSRERLRRKSPDRSREKPEELRRDPAKTKHDIEKDKDKCLRYKEAKEFEKTIIVAESGLCPPGMEDMIDEVNNSSFKPIKRNPLTINFENEKGNQKVSTERDNGKFVTTVTETDLCTMKFSSERRKSRSRSTERSRNERYRDSRDLRDIIIERLANKERSPPYDRSRISPDNRSRSNHSPISARYDRGHSPNTRRRDYSPTSGDSDREMWLRDYGRLEKRRKRSPFIKELARALCNKDNKNLNPIPNQPTFNPFNSESVSYNPRQTMGQFGPPHIFDPNQMPMLQHPMDHAAMPLVNNGNFPFQSDVPPPFAQQQFAIPQQPFQGFQPPGPYDGVKTFVQPPPSSIRPGPPPFQSFQPVPNSLEQLGNLSSNQVPIGLGVPLTQVYSADMQQENNTKQIISPSLTKLQNSNRNIANLKDISSKNQQHLSKLFEDKKISLSDFLTVSAKGETAPCNIQEKIKVLSRCQDAIRALDTTKKSGRFFPTTLLSSLNENQDSKAQSKWKSPLKKMTIVKFSFTTPSKGNENEVQNNMKKLLASLNLHDRVFSSPPPRIQKSTSVSESIPITAPILTSKQKIVKDMHIQTDPYVCNVCEIRSARTFTEMATQTTKLEGLDEATQVSPFDLPAPPPPRGILKNSNYPSLSHLTAAQLREQDQLRNQRNSRNSPGPFTSSSSSPSLIRPLFDGPLDSNLEFNQLSKKMRSQYQDSLDQSFNPLDSGSSQIQNNNPWASSWNDLHINPNFSVAQNLPSWKQNQIPSSAWNQSFPASGTIAPNMPWMSVLSTPPNKRNLNNNRGGYNKRKSNHVNLTK